MRVDESGSWIEIEQKSTQSQLHGEGWYGAGIGGIMPHLIIGVTRFKVQSMENQMLEKTKELKKQNKWNKDQFQRSHSNQITALMEENLI